MAEPTAQYAPRWNQWSDLHEAAEAVGAAISPSCTGELVIYTGLAFNRQGNPVPWCEECESGDELPEQGCDFCGRPPAQNEGSGAAS